MSDILGVSLVQTPQSTTFMAVNQLKAGAALNYVILGLNALTGLLYTPYMLRMLGQNEFGIYTLAASVIAYLSLLDFGFGNAVIRYTAKLRAKGDKEGQYSLFGTFTVLYSVIGIIALALGLVLWANTDNMFGATMTADELTQTKTVILLMVLNVAVSFPLSIYGSIITAYENFIFLRMVSIIRIFVSTGVLVLILYCGYKAIGLVVVQTMFNIAGLLINAIYCNKKLKVKVKFNNFNRPLIREIAVYSFWIFLNVIMDRIYWSTGQFVLGVTAGPTTVAIYGIAITIMSIYMSYSTAIAGVLLPRITSMVTLNANDREISDIFIRTGRIQFIIMGLILSGFIVFGGPFIRIWAGADYADAFPIAVIFLTALLIPLIQNVGITILQARNQMRFRSLLYVSIAIVTLGAQILLAPKYGGIGCAFAIGAALLLGQGLIMNIYYQRKQHIDILKFWCEIGRMMPIPVLMTIIGLYIVNSLPELSISQILLAMAVYITIYIPLFWLCSMNMYERELVRAPFAKVLRRIRCQ